MTRYTKTFPTNLSFEEFNSIVSGMMKNNGFKPKNIKNEPVWQKGAGWLTAPQFITTVYNGNSITITAFIKFAFIPGLWYGGESDLDGFVGCIPKQALKGVVDSLENTLQQTAYNKQIYINQQQAAQQQNV